MRCRFVTAGAAPCIRSALSWHPRAWVWLTKHGWHRAPAEAEDGTSHCCASAASRWPGRLATAVVRTGARTAAARGVATPRRGRRR